MGFEEDLRKGVFGKMYSMKMKYSEENFVFRVEGLDFGHETFSQLLAEAREKGYEWVVSYEGEKRPEILNCRINVGVSAYYPPRCRGLEGVFRTEVYPFDLVCRGANPTLEEIKLFKEAERRRAKERRMEQAGARAGR